MWDLLGPLLITGGTVIGAEANKKALDAQTGVLNQVYQSANARAQPGISYLRQVVAEPDALSPAQQQQLQDLRENLATQLHNSNFAGSGRTAVDLIKRGGADFTNTAIDQNQRAAEGAARVLAGGQSTADRALEQIGAARGAEGLANARMFGTALGDIGSLINRQTKLRTVSPAPIAPPPDAFEQV